jgi:hypothetical protein
MPLRRLSAPARRFLAEEVHSVLQLELMLLLAAAPSRSWTANEAARELRAPEPWVAGQLTDLVVAGIARADGSDPAGHRFAGDGAWALVIADIADQFRRRRTTIIKLIFAPAASDIQSFSDAFRLRPEEDD